MGRLTLDLTDQEHEALLRMAASHGQSIKQFAHQRLFSNPRDATDRAWSEFGDFIQGRIQGVAADGVSELSVEAIVESELAIGLSD